MNELAPDPEVRDLSQFALEAECAGAMSEGCPRAAWIGALDEQDLSDIG